MRRTARSDAEAGTCRKGRGGTFGASRSCETLRSVYRQQMPLSCLELTVREAHLGQWSQDPKIGRTYDRKRSDPRAATSLQVGGRPHMNRARCVSAIRLRSLTQADIMCRSPEALARRAAASRHRYHCPSRGCLVNRSRDCTRFRAPPSFHAGVAITAPRRVPLPSLRAIRASITFAKEGCAAAKTILPENLRRRRRWRWRHRSFAEEQIMLLAGQKRKTGPLCSS